MYSKFTCLSHRQPAQRVLHSLWRRPRPSLSVLCVVPTYVRSRFLRCGAARFTKVVCDLGVLSATASQSVPRSTCGQISFHYRFIQNDLLPQIFNNSEVLVFIHGEKSLYLEKVLHKRLEAYERLIEHRPPINLAPLTFAQSLYFAFTSCTTISNAHIRPLSYRGRIVALLFSIAGIPFTLVVVREMEHIITRLLSCPCILFGELLQWPTLHALLQHILRFSSPLAGNSILHAQKCRRRRGASKNEANGQVAAWRVPAGHCAEASTHSGYRLRPRHRWMGRHWLCVGELLCT